MTEPGSHRIVATHGLGDSARTWADLATALADHGVRVDVWDLAGHGEVAPPSNGPYLLDAALAEMRDVIHAGPVPTVLMGHSLGGYLSLRYTLDHPDDVRALVLVATGPGYRSDEAREEWNQYVERRAGKMGIAPGVEQVCMQHDSAVIDGLAGIEVPVVLFTGAGDERFHAGGDVIAAKVPHGEHRLVPDAGHHPHLDAPEAMAAEIGAFVGRL